VAVRTPTKLSPVFTEKKRGIVTWPKTSKTERKSSALTCEKQIGRSAQYTKNSNAWDIPMGKVVKNLFSK